jgi:hypothetical protein
MKNINFSFPTIGNDLNWKNNLYFEVIQTTEQKQFLRSFFLLPL